jgi:tripartite-type tricarboxylate transporter receptor subunit TctC
MTRALFACLAFVASFAVAPVPAAAQQRAAPDADTRPIRLLVGFPSGSNTDQAARVLADALRERLGGRPIEVTNRPGSAGSIAAEAVARAAPDGTTLGFFSSSLAIARHVARALPFDPRTDFTPISLFATVPFVVLVSPDYPARDLRQLAETLRARPDTRCVTPGAGSFTHLTTVLLTRAMGTAPGCEAVHYSDPGQAMADLRTGRVHLYVTTAPSGLPAVREDRARALAVTSGRRLAAASEVPTTAEAGLAGFEAEAWWGLFGPRGLPEAVTGRLERAAVEAARDPAVAARLRALGAEPVGSTGAELAAKLQAEDAKWGEAARAAGISAE